MSYQTSHPTERCAAAVTRPAPTCMLRRHTASLYYPCVWIVTPVNIHLASSIPSSPAPHLHAPPPRSRQPTTRPSAARHGQPGEERKGLGWVGTHTGELAGIITRSDRNNGSNYCNFRTVHDCRASAVADMACVGEQPAVFRVRACSSVYLAVLDQGRHRPQARPLARCALYHGLASFPASDGIRRPAPNTWLPTLWLKTPARGITKHPST